MVLSRTRRSAKLALKGLVFDSGNLQEVLDVRRRHALEDSMGFRGQWDEHRRFQVDFLKAQGLLPSHTFLEIGCGPLTAGVPIIEYLQPNKYFGIDIRRSVLDLAWGEVARAGLSAKNPRLICSSSFGAEELDEEQFDVVFSFSVLYHLNDELLRAYFHSVARRMKSTGLCVAQVNTQSDESTWLEFPFLKRKIDTYCAMAGEAGLKTRSLGTIERLGFRLSGEEKLNEMLSFVKFEASN